VVLTGYTIFFQHNILVGKLGDVVQLIVPHSLRQRLFLPVHTGPLAVYLASQRTLAQLRRLYYWPGMRKGVDVWCRQCGACATSKDPRNRPHAGLQKVIASEPMDLVAIDILSGLPTSHDGSKYHLVATDYFTKAIPLSDAKASTCIRALYDALMDSFLALACLDSYIQTSELTLRVD